MDLKFILVSTLILSPVAIAGQSYDLRELGEGYEDVIINHELPPGVYIFDVMTNGDLVDKKISISFVHSDAGLKPILTRKLLHTVGVDFSKLPKLDQTISDVGNVSGISEFIEQGNLTTNFDAMTLDFIVPQYYLLDKALNEKLDRNYQTGENLAFVTYYASGFNLDSYKSHSLNLDFGANYNGWSYRHSGAYFDSSDGDKGYNTYNNYIEKPLVAMKSKVRIGSSYTNQNDSSFSFIGASLKSESRMLPREMRGYAPVVSGIAQSNAIVEVFQNSSLIYREIVSPGYFEISNLRDTGSSGDLNVIITEENGEERKFIQPYASSSNMLREGLYTYYIDVGKHDDSDLSQAYFINSNLTYGLTKQLTGSFGALVSQDYVSYNTNFDFSLNEFGVFSLGYQIGSKGTDGYTLQASYAKDFSSTGTNVTFSNYIYESENWSSFDEYINWIDYDANELPFTNKKSRQGVNLTQRLPYGMSANISGYKETYWDSKETYNLTLSTAKSFSFGTISIMFNQISNEDSKDDKQLFANVNLPIGLSGRGSVNTSYRTNLSGQSQRTLGIQVRHWTIAILHIMSRLLGMKMKQMVPST
ncbi:outer membrane usher protein fimD precursor [Vibrio astriarenae]|nr:outer membrane usher protein fimD precursor [Vibrio sp. C7]